MLEEQSLRTARKTRDIFVVSIIVFLEEKLNEQRNVFESLREREDANLDGAEAERFFTRHQDCKYLGKWSLRETETRCAVPRRIMGGLCRIEPGGRGKRVKNEKAE